MALALEWNDARLRKELALIPPRAALGATMVYHGLGKLKGEGPQQAGQMFGQLGLKPAKPLAVATGIAEAFAGCAAILGIWTRPAALAVLVTQGVAVAKVHAALASEAEAEGVSLNQLVVAKLALHLEPR